MGYIDKVSVAGTSYDVRDTLARSVDDRVNVLHDLVNYGYDAAFSGTDIVTSREGTRVKMNGTVSSSSTATKVLLSGEVRLVTGSTWPSAATQGITLKDGHTYRLRIKPIGGTFTNADNMLLPRWYAQGSLTAIGSTSTDAAGYSDLQYAAGQYANGVFAAFSYRRSSTGATATNYEVEVTVEDITQGALVSYDNGTAADTTFGSGDNTVSFTRMGARVTMNGSFPVPSTTTRARIKLNGTAAYAGTSSATDAFGTPLTLVDGHVYRFRQHITGGSASQSVTPIFLASGGHSIISTAVTHDGDACAVLAYSSTTYASGVQLCIDVVRNNTDATTVTNFAALYTLEDITGGSEVYGSTPSITAQEGMRYVCGEVTSLSFTPCAKGLCEVVFTSGTSATVLTLPESVIMPDWWDGVAASRTYDIMIMDGVYGVVTSWAT